MNIFSLFSVKFVDKNGDVFEGDEISFIRSEKIEE